LTCLERVPKGEINELYLNRVELAAILIVIKGWDADDLAMFQPKIERLSTTQAGTEDPLRILDMVLIVQLFKPLLEGDTGGSQAGAFAFYKKATELVCGHFVLDVSLRFWSKIMLDLW
jgi:hypothetical protein